MDQIPSEFVDKVLTQLDYGDLKNLTLKSNLWNERASAHLKQRSCLRIYVCANRNGLKYSITSWDNTFGFTIDEVRAMDRRILQILQFSVHRLSGEVEKKFAGVLNYFPIDQLPHLLAFVCRFHLNRVTIDLPPSAGTLQDQIIGQLHANNLQTKLLELSHSTCTEAYVKVLKMRVKTTTKLMLVGDGWPSGYLKSIRGITHQNRQKYFRKKLFVWAISLFVILISYCMLTWGSSDLIGAQLAHSTGLSD